jgi:hypothetical protein
MTNIPGAQVSQDIFALTTTTNKTYIEIGASGPIKYNNTYQLELKGWKGISLEFNQGRVDQWKDIPERKNKIYCADAITFDYYKALEENALPMHLGYLSCDIEPPKNTFAALKRVIEQGITFDCITFEHDRYQSEIDYDPIVTEYLKDQGYKIAVKDVYRWRKRPCYFETWYVHSSISYTEKTFDEWRNSTNLDYGNYK